MEEEAAHISKGLPLLLREGPHLTVSIRRAGEVEGSFDDLGFGGVERPDEVPTPVQRSRQPCFGRRWWRWFGHGVDRVRDVSRARSDARRGGSESISKRRSRWGPTT